MILGLVEHEDGEPTEESLEMLTLARELEGLDDGSTVGAVAFADDGTAAGADDGTAAGADDGTADGADAEALADSLGDHGVDEIHHVVHDRLDGYAPEAWGDSVAQLASETDPRAVLAPGTDRGHEVLAHAAAGLELPMAANVVAVEPDGGGSDAGDHAAADGGDGNTDDGYQVTRHRWGGSLIEHARLESPTLLLTTAPHEIPIEPADEATSPEVRPFEPSLEDRHLRVRVDRLEESDEEGIPLGEARVVVGGGRGVGGPENFDQLEELAELLGGTVGSSRAAVNEGWRPHDDQIGLTGAKISPDIYIACGISGAVQHMVGCKGADTTLAINTDPEAAIVQKAQYAVIGDLHEIVPALNKAIRERS